MSASQVYAGVLREGALASGDPVRLLTAAEALALTPSPAR